MTDIATQATEDSTATETGTSQEETTTEKTFSQEDVNKLLATQKREIREKFADYDELRERVSKVDELTNANTSLTGQLDSLKLDNLRLTVAMKKSLPPELAERLRGATEEELEADAESLLKFATKASPKIDAGVREEETPLSMNDLIRRQLR